MNSNLKGNMTNRYFRKLVLGCDYNVFWIGNKPVPHRFIKVTKKGYNFLNMETNKCLLKQHLYLTTSKKYEPRYCINKRLIINKQ